MFIVVVTLSVLSNFAISAVIPSEKDSTILNYNYENDGRGNYMFSYNTSNGIKRSETGRLVNEDLDDEHIVVQGFFSYIDQDGISRFVLYTADENGYRQMVNSTMQILNYKGTQYRCGPKTARSRLCCSGDTTSFSVNTGIALLVVSTRML